MGSDTKIWQFKPLKRKIKSYAPFIYLFFRYEEGKKKLPRKGASREQQTLALLQRFSAKIVGAFNADSDSDEQKEKDHVSEDDDDAW